MPVAVEPAAGTVPAAGGTITHTLTNSEAGKIVFKVQKQEKRKNAKGSRFVRMQGKKYYRLKPVFGFIDAGATAQVEITRLAGPPSEAYLRFEWALAPVGAADAQEAFEAIDDVSDVVKVSIKAK